jgi:hypothetical protein
MDGTRTAIRGYQASDLERLKDLHRMQGFEYNFPDLSDPVFALNSVVEDGEIQAAAFVKILGEAYLFINPEYADPLTRWQMLLRVHEDMRRQASDIGLSEVTCFVPPELPKRFLKRLVGTKKKPGLGWQLEPSEWKRAAYHLRKVTL